ncbi:MAG: heme NO-binding domain-containing protein [Actinomycetia bacterium]|nr:heme NO-binding domain-containing protein [Actinomycetes bacterium]
MKGIVFNDFLEMVEEDFDVVQLDLIMQTADLPGDGVYTSVGNYDYSELLGLIVAASEVTGVAIPALLYAFGHHLFQTLGKRFPELLAPMTGAFDLFLGIEDIIHAEVRKLYPDAELPRFECALVTPNQMTMLYESPRRLAVLAHGLIDAGAEHFDEDISVTAENLSDSPDEKVLFTLERAAV